MKKAGGNYPLLILFAAEKRTLSKNPERSVLNGTPIPCMTPYDLIIVDKDSALEFAEAYYPAAIVS